jgi:hypothetical protein
MLIATPRRALDLSSVCLAVAWGRVLSLSAWTRGAGLGSPS